MEQYTNQFGLLKNREQRAPDLGHFVTLLNEIKSVWLYILAYFPTLFIFGILLSHFHQLNAEYMQWV